MNELNLNLTPREQRLINELALRFQSSVRQPHVIQIDDIKREANEKVEDVKNVAGKIERLGFVKWHTNRSIEILVPIVVASHQISNPPAKNYLTEITKWWFSSVWRSVVTAIALILPLAVQWIEMIQTCLKWILQLKT